MYWIAAAVVVFIALCLCGVLAAREVKRGRQEREDFHGKIYRRKD